MNTYEYKINDLQRDDSNIIIAAAFTITASDDIDSYTHNYHTAFATPKGSITDFSKVTEAQIIGWIKVMFDTQDNYGNKQNALEKQADAELTAFKQRKEVKSGLPWEI